MDFSRRRPKMSKRTVPTEIFGVSEFFLSKVCRKKVSRSGTSKSDVFGVFFKNQSSKFLPTRKKRVFCVADFFEKSIKWGVSFEGAPPNFFLKFVLM